MNAGEFFEIIVITLLFLLDVAAVRWIAGQDTEYMPPRVVRHYLFYRQHKLSQLFPMLP